MAQVRKDLIEASSPAPGGVDSQRPGEGWRMAWICLALAALTWAVFGQTLRNGFINFDDDTYVYKNEVVAKGLTWKGLVWAFSGSHADNWHPVTWISHELDCQLYGLKPGGHHASNVAIHTAGVIALFLVLRFMTGALWRSALVAAVFAIHPLRVESVAWVAERKDVLCGLFFMLAVGAYARYARAKEKSSWLSAGVAYYVLALMFFLLGLLSKPMLVTLPAVLLLLDFWPLERKESIKTLVVEKIPWLALSAILCLITIWAQRNAMQTTTSFPLGLRCMNAVMSYVVYLGQMLYPADLSPFYPYPHHGIAAWKVAGALLLLAVVSGTAWVNRRTRPWMLAGWLWYLVMLLPVSGIMQAGEQSHADRFTYLPQIGLTVCLTWLTAECLEKWRVPCSVHGGLALGLLAVLAIASWKQTAFWRTSEILWQRDLSCTTENALAHLNLGVALGDEGKPDEAIKQFQATLQIDPNVAKAHFNLGNAFRSKGRADDAIAEYQKTLRIDPNDAEAHNNLGNLLLDEGKPDEAKPHYEGALQVNPDDAGAHLGLGTALLQEGKPDEAIAQYQAAIQIQSDYADAYYNLGLAMLQKGLQGDAIANFQKALRIDPNLKKARGNLANVLYKQGKLDEALAQYEQALRIKPETAIDHLNYASALKQKGQAKEAAAQYQAALRIEPNDPRSLDSYALFLATSPDSSVRDGAEAVRLAKQANELSGGRNPAALRILAASFAEAGMFGDAERTAREAVDLAESAGRPDWAEQFKKELQIYQAKHPLHP